MANKKFETLDGFLSSGDVEITGNVAVDTDTLFVDSVNNRVGIGKTNPTTLLDVDGNITATNVNATFYGDGSNLTGLVADSIEGANVTSLLRSDVSDEFTGTTFTFNGANVIIKETNSQLVLFQDVPLRFGNTSTPGVSFNFSRTGPSTGTFDIDTLGTITLSINNDLSVNGAITADSFTGTVDASTVGGNTAAHLNAYANAAADEAFTNAAARADTAYTNATSYADTAAATAYSNATLYTDNEISALVNTAPALLDTLNELAAAINDDPDFANSVTNQITTAYTNATSYADTAAATAYSNATSYADTKAATAYSNATSYADTAAGTAYTNATSYADTAAATAYTNATSYADTAAGTAFSNAISTIGDGSSLGNVDAATVGGNTAATLLSRTNHTGTQLLSTISDAGTIASQDSDSVTITGGSINGVPIGASTANTAEFTQITLDGPMREISSATSSTTPTLSATNGPIITWTPSGTATGTVSLVGGGTGNESLLVLLTTGGNTVSWSGVDKWVGGSAPTLDGTETNAIEFWKVGATTYGAFVGVVS